jgi:hypothetical protein
MGLLVLTLRLVAVLDDSVHAGLLLALLDRRVTLRDRDREAVGAHARALLVGHVDLLARGGPRLAVARTGHDDLQLDLHDGLLSGSGRRGETRRNQLRRLAIRKGSGWPMAGQGVPLRAPEMYAVIVTEVMRGYSSRRRNSVAVASTIT